MSQWSNPNGAEAHPLHQASDKPWYAGQAGIIGRVFSADPMEPRY